MEKLSTDQVETALKLVPEWGLDDKFIVRRYKFPTFLEGINFVNQVANLAEQRNHHPFISIDYKVVTLRMTSWHAGGLTQLDFDEAQEFDRTYDGMLADK